jgi:probable HAF family extracellular repeat protein/autotransporter-associated beta strand protein
VQKVNAMKKLLPLIAAVLLTCCPEKTVLYASSVYYEVTDLSGLLGTGSSSAVDINNNGQIIGQGPNGAFIYYGGTATNIGNCNVYAINNNGQVVGADSQSAFMYCNGTTTHLENDTTAAYDINDSGYIVGYGNFIVDAGGTRANRGFIYYNDDITVLGTLCTETSATSYAYSINDYGQVVGNASYPTHSTNTAFLYNGTMINLGTLGGATSTANVINNSGKIVGLAATLSQGNHAFLYDNEMIDLSNIIFNNCRPTTANDINNCGLIVGNAAGLSGGGTVYLYDGSTMTDLNSMISTSGYIISSANAINDRGQIVATGKYLGSSYYTRALLLTPASRTWDGGGTDDNWNTPANWNPDAVPVNGSELIFSGVLRQTNINNMNLVCVGLVTFNNGGFHISGNPLVLNAGITSTGDNDWGIDSTLAQPQAFTSLSGVLTISGNVNNNGNLLTINGSGDHLISGAISGAGGLTKSGSGTSTLSSTANCYTGDTTVTAGVLEITGGVNIGATELINIQAGKAVLKTTNVNNDTLNIQNDSDGIFQVADGIHILGSVQGSGTTEVDGQLTVNCISQATLSIASGGVVTITPLPGGPQSESPQLTAVPEPTAFILIISAVLCLLLYKRLGQ